VDKWESDDSDIEIISHTLPSGKASTDSVIVKAEPLPATIPAPATMTKPAAVKRFKTETPLASIPRGSRKASTSKCMKGDDSDAENSPPTARKTKHVRRDTSFDMEGFLLDDRKHRGEFEKDLLHQVRQGTAEFRKAADDTRAFQTEFLGILRGVFPQN
jgi:hypothetical protein